MLQKYLAGLTVWAFGSRVTGKARVDSDLDLVVFAQAEQSRAVYDFKEACEESALSCRVDVLIWGNLPLSFHEAIQKNKIILQE